MHGEEAQVSNVCRCSWCNAAWVTIMKTQPPDFEQLVLRASLPTVTRDSNVTQKTVSGMVQRMCCVFGIISSVVKQLQASGKKQWSTLGFVQLCCSFEAF